MSGPVLRPDLVAEAARNARLVSAETERAILAACLASPEVLPMLIGRLSPHHFFDRGRKLVWLALLGLAQDAEPVNLLTLEARLARQGQLADAGGRAELLALDLDLPASDEQSVLAYCATLDDRLVRRRLVDLAGKLRHEAESFQGDARELPARLARSLDTLETRSNGPTSPDLGSVLGEVYPPPDRGAEGLPGLRTGFPRWDEMTGGMTPGALWMLGGRTGRGKTSFALQVALPQARAGVRVGVRSMEMTRQELALRVLAQEGRVDSRALRFGRLTYHQRRGLDDVRDGLLGLPLYIEDSGPRRVLDICSWARRMRLGLVVVDHLDMLDRANEPGGGVIIEAAVELKALAKELPGTVLALRQLNRYGARDKDSKPQDEDLRYGGENDCDLVTFIHQKDDHAELRVSKNRFGPTGTVRLNWQPEIVRFQEEA